MKAHSLIIAGALLGFYTASASAAPLPLNHPKGLALDAKGNLYVANFGSGGGGPEAPQGNILAYNPQYVQLAGKSFGGGDINAPTGVAFDTFGKLYVSNAGNWKVTVYDPAKHNQQDTARTLTNGVKYPLSVAVDGVNNVWVVNSDGTSPSLSSVTMYNGFNGQLLNRGTPPSYTNAVATKGSFVSLAEVAKTEILLNFGVLTNDVPWSTGPKGAATAVAYDSQGVLYIGTQDQRLIKCTYPKPPSNTYCSRIRGVDYVPSGIAVDAQRDRIYVSSDDRSTVDVFKRDGTFINTFH